jgi:hypothetical protein
MYAANDANVGTASSSSLLLRVPASTASRTSRSYCSAPRRVATGLTLRTRVMDPSGMATSDGHGVTWLLSG